MEKSNYQFKKQVIAVLDDIINECPSFPQDFVDIDVNDPLFNSSCALSSFYHRVREFRNHLNDSCRYQDICEKFGVYSK